MGGGKDFLEGNDRKISGSITKGEEKPDVHSKFFLGLGLET